jgi:DNA topoisomerase-1
MNYIRIINKGKRPWDLGCPHCNFLDWQAKKAQAKAEPEKKLETKTESNGLGKVPGIGPKTLEKLSSAGIMTSQDLLKARAKALAEKTGLSEKKIMAWKSAAKALS